ncbi:hypothetical protein EK21DRAFT_20294, partial [Setomelanomma holmii]
VLLLLEYYPRVQAAPASLETAVTKHNIGCHEFVSSHHDFILFRTLYDEDQDFDFAIETRYTTFYPTVLKMALKLDYFVPNVYIQQAKCGWHKARSVRSPSWSQVGQHRGTIFWKYSDLDWVEHLKNYTHVSHWRAASPDHIPPRTGALPSNRTLDRIATILQDNEPAADVYQLATVLLGYTTGFLGFILILFV